MPNLKISELPAAGALTGAELMEAVQGGINVQTTITDIIAGAGGGGHVIEDEGTPLTQRTKLNFVGAGVTVTDDSGDDASVVTISGGASTDASETVKGVVEEATDAEVLAGTATGGTGAQLFITPAKYKVSPVSVAISLVSTTITLDGASMYSRKWYSTALSANTTVTKTNKTVLEYGNWVFLVTGTIILTLDSDDIMPDDTPGWNNGTKQLQLVSGGTGLVYSLGYNRVGSNFLVVISTKATV